MDYHAIGQRVRRYRKLRGYSQEQLAEKIDISTTHMSHIETGSTKLSLPVLVNLAKVLEVRTDDLLGCGTDSTQKAYAEIAAVLERCTLQESRIIADLVNNTKKSLENNL